MKLEKQTPTNQYQRDQSRALSLKIGYRRSLLKPRRKRRVAPAAPNLPQLAGNQTDRVWWKGDFSRVPFNGTRQAMRSGRVAKRGCPAAPPLRARVVFPMPSTSSAA